MVGGLFLSGGAQRANAANLPLLMRPYGEALQLCMRQWEKMTGAYRMFLPSSSIIGLSVPYKVVKRSNPSVAYVTPGGVITNSNFVDMTTTLYGSSIQFNGTANTESYNFNFVTTADARLP